ncbi:hypothetical protein GGQ88_002753 [Novosphingobium hassiacum]|uniref:Uncharacterized protein n=1 Tax=Novosphingobium hassiacum TaxID=173676 RepID=A0A7W6EX44_9SPHN|nr:hypothetical protein [Novosphingobium hassiacum]
MRSSVGYPAIRLANGNRTAEWGTMRPAITFDPASARALLEGRKTQVRLGAGHWLGRLEPGEIIFGHEACAPGRVQDGVELLTDIKRAEFVAFSDGWRRDRAGNGWQGRPLVDPNEKWIAAPHMPAWACRIRLELVSRRTEQLQDISLHDLTAEGLVSYLGGLLWRWPASGSKLHLSARKAFAACWDTSHPVPGLSWADNPAILVLTVKRV